MTAPAAEEITELLGLVPLPEEGGLYHQTHADAYGTAIYYLLDAPEFSALHRLPGVEVLHHYAGGPARTLLLHPDGGHETRLLGSDLAAGQRPQLVVPGGVWQGTEVFPTDGGPTWALLGATMAPGYRDADFTLSPAGPLTDRWPDAAAAIARLTRS